MPFDLAIFRRTFSPNWRHMYDSLGIPGDRTEEAVQVWRETFRSDRTRPFDGVQGALARLVMGGYTLGVVTGGDRAEVEPQLRRLGIDDLMTVRVYGNDTSAGKPHPAPLLLALELAGGCAPAEAVYVGDALGRAHRGRSCGDGSFGGRVGRPNPRNLRYRSGYVVVSCGGRAPLIARLIRRYAAIEAPSDGNVPPSQCT